MKLVGMKFKDEQFKSLCNKLWKILISGRLCEEWLLNKSLYELKPCKTSSWKRYSCHAVNSIGSTSFIEDTDENVWERKMS